MMQSFQVLAQKVSEECPILEPRPLGIALSIMAEIIKYTEAAVSRTREEKEANRV